MIILSRKVNETIVVGTVIEVTVLEILGERFKIGVDAPREVILARQELVDRVDARIGAGTGPDDTPLRQVQHEPCNKTISSRLG